MGKKRRKPQPKTPEGAPKSPPTDQQLPAQANVVKQSYRIPFVAGSLIALTVLGGSILYWVNHRTAQRFNGSMIQRSNASQKSPLASFVGSEACARCHQKEYDLWKQSTHGHAGGKPGEATVIARFDGQPLYFKDAVVTPSINAKGEYIFSVEAEGQSKNEIKVYATVGGGHMQGGGTQSFFQRFADGTVRFLPFDFIRRENLWFVQRRNDRTWTPISKEISLQNDLANWPPNRVLGTLTEFSNCQNCHGSQIAVTYDRPNRKYETHFQTLQINCESCHGPGKRHLEIVSKAGFEKLTDIGMEPLATLSKDQSLTVCFQCHATKDAIREDPYLPGERLEDYFSLKLPVFDETYTVDGRIRNFGYQSTHLFSDCYLNGSMTCVDCHEPHSQQYRDVFGKALVGRFDNGQCTSCHASKGLAAEAHSHHKTDSPGNLCTSCHMPYLQEHGIGERLTYARSDHGIPIPRPAFDQQMGIENACQKCHRDKDLPWQEARVKEWYGEIKPHNRAIANLLKGGETQDALTAAKLLIDPAAKHPMAQMTGLVTYMKRFLRPNMEQVDPEILIRLKAFLQSPDLDLKSLALTALHLSFDQDPSVRSSIDNQLRRPGPQNDPVRNRWAVAADYFGNGYAGSGDLANALICFKKSLEVKSDNIVTISHLAIAYLRSGDPQNAMVWLKNGLKLRPEKAVLHFQLAQTYAQLQQIPEAINELEEGLKYAPEDQMAKRILQQLRGP